MEVVDNGTAIVNRMQQQQEAMGKEIQGRQYYSPEVYVTILLSMEFLIKERNNYLEYIPNMVCYLVLPGVLAKFVAEGLCDVSNSRWLSIRT